MTDNRDKERKERGAEAEQRAAEHLLLEGYTLRERNWRPGNSHLEVDIIAQTGRTIVFVEVKARADGDTDPADAVDGRKMRRLVRAAAAYLAQQPEDDLEYRFDIITVSGSGPEARLDHIPDAFLPPLGTR